MTVAGYPLWLVGAVGFVTLLLVGAGAYFVYLEKRRLAEELNNLDTSDDGADVLQPPEIDGSLVGLVQMWRHRAKSKRLARKGYVRWFKLGSTLSKPKWVKPTPDGSGVPVHYDSDDEQTYLFPEGAMVTDQQTGAYVAIHHHNQPEPVPIRDPAMPAIDGDRLEEVINLEAESDAPGFFDRLDLDAQTMMWGVIGLVMILAGASQFLG